MTSTSGVAQDFVIRLPPPLTNLICLCCDDADLRAFSLVSRQWLNFLASDVLRSLFVRRNVARGFIRKKNWDIRPSLFSKSTRSSVLFMLRANVQDDYLSNARNQVLFTLHEEGVVSVARYQAADRTTRTIPLGGRIVSIGVCRETMTEKVRDIAIWPPYFVTCKMYSSVIKLWRFLPRSQWKPAAQPQKSVEADAKSDAAAEPTKKKVEPKKPGILERIKRKFRSSDAQQQKSQQQTGSAERKAATVSAVSAGQANRHPADEKTASTVAASGAQASTVPASGTTKQNASSAAATPASAVKQQTSPESPASADGENAEAEEDEEVDLNSQEALDNAQLICELNREDYKASGDEHSRQSLYVMYFGESALFGVVLMAGYSDGSMRMWNIKGELLLRTHYDFTVTRSPPPAWSPDVDNDGDADWVTASSASLTAATSAAAAGSITSNSAGASAAASTAAAATAAASTSVDFIDADSNGSAIATAPATIDSNSLFGDAVASGSANTGDEPLSYREALQAGRSANNSNRRNRIPNPNSSSPSSNRSNGHSERKSDKSSTSTSSSSAASEAPLAHPPDWKRHPLPVFGMQWIEPNTLMMETPAGVQRCTIAKGARGEAVIVDRQCVISVAQTAKIERFDFNLSRSHLLMFHANGELFLYSMRSGASKRLLEPSDQRTQNRMFLRQGRRFLLAGHAPFKGAPQQLDVFEPLTGERISTLHWEEEKFWAFGVYPDRDAFLVLDDLRSNVAVAHFCPLVPALWYGAVPPLLQQRTASTAAQTATSQPAVVASAEASRAAK